MVGYTVENYSEKAIGVFGDVQYYVKVLTDLGGKYNPALKGLNNTRRAGFIFPLTKKATVESALKNAKPTLEPESILTSEPTSPPITSSTNSSSNSSSNQSTSNIDVSVDIKQLITSMTSTLVERIQKVENRCDAYESEIAILRKCLEENGQLTSISRPKTSGVSKTLKSTSKPIVKKEIDENDEEEEEESKEIKPHKRLLSKK